MARPSPSPSGRPERNLVQDAASIAEAYARRPAAYEEDTWRSDTPTNANLGTKTPNEREELMASMRENESGPAAGRGRAAQLREENEELRLMIQDLKQQIEGAGSQDPGAWEEKEREFETILEEKSEEIRLLYMRIQEIEQQRNEPPPERAPRPGSSDDEELNSLAEELAQEQTKVEDERQAIQTERQQLRQDEEELESRMQEMELQTAKSRADLVKQRNELQRLYNEVRQEIEQARQNGVITDRVQNLEREAQALKSKRGN